MTREDLLKSREYWTTKIQIDLFELIETYRKEHGLNKTQLAKQLGVSKGYVTQILKGDFDHRVSKLVDLALAFGKVPQIEYKDLSKVLEENKRLKDSRFRKAISSAQILSGSKSVMMIRVDGSSTVSAKISDPEVFTLRGGKSNEFKFDIKEKADCI